MKTKIKVLTIILFLIVLFGKNAFSQGWVQLNSGTTSNLTFVQFLDANTGFVGAPLLRTINGGLNWTTINTPATPGGIFFLDINNGYFSSGNEQGGGHVYKTTNGGLNWTSLNVGSNYVSEGIYFLNVNTGYCVNIAGEMQVYKTTDGGISWNETAYLGIYNDTYWVGKLFFINQNEGYINAIHGSLPPLSPEDAEIWKTNDGGNNWGIYLNSTPTYPVCSKFIDISMPQPSSGFVLYGGLAATDSILFYNGNFDFQANSFLFGINCPDPAHAWAVGASGSIYTTSDTGIIWTAQNSGVSTQLNEVLFLNDQTGYIVGDSGAILKTSTGGLAPVGITGQIRFQDNNQPVTMGIVKALHYDRVSDQIFTVDSASIQSNGTYSLIHVLPQDSIYIMAFENDESMLVFVPTYYPSSTTWQNATVLYPTGNLSNIDVLVYRINNTGGSYHIGGHVYINYNNPLVALKDAIVYAKIINEFKSYSVTDYSGFYQVDSLPSGMYTLIVERIGHEIMKKSVVISNYSKDSIDITPNLTEMVHDGNIIPVKYWLGNNYPNPFNPVTRISFGIPKEANTKLVIYDITGREVSELINKELNAGNYTINWNAANYSSGIYFYKLESGDFVRTKKMVVLK
ncbi:MAG: T9SS type A sorting domain-containing protein [Ignavibacteria bacterium]